jgi:uncharacterized protein (TIGR03067 family)
MAAALCPNRETLRRYSLGLLSDEQSDDLAGHLESCSDCQATIVNLEDATDTLVGRLRTSPGNESCLEEPQFQAVMAKAIVMPTPASLGLEASAPLQNLGEYQLLEELGRGGMGRVYKALHTKLDRIVAVKVLPLARTDDPQAISRFEREMKAVGRLAHPHIVQAYDAREIDGTPVLIMEYVDGLDLAEIVRRVGPLPVADACELVRQTAVALQCAHEHGLVHRDIKPSNIMLSQTGEVKLLDLGLSRFYADAATADEMTGAGQAMGTADYMAPEQASDSRTVDIRADLYSLGCTLYKLLSGRAPFSGPDYRGTFDKLNAHVRQTPIPIRQLVPEVPEQLAAILGRLLAKDPKNRYAAPAEVAQAVEPFADESDLLDLIEYAESVPAGSEAVPAAPSFQDAPAPQPLAAPHRWKSLVKLALLGLLFGGFGYALAIIIQIKQDGKETTIRITEDGEKKNALSAESKSPMVASVSDEQAIQGTWEVVGSSFSLVQKLPMLPEIAAQEILKTTKVVITADALKIVGRHVTGMALEYRLNPAAKTKIIDLQTAGSFGLVSYGIYQLEGDQLKICASALRLLDAEGLYDPAGRPMESRQDARDLRPSEFWSEFGSGKELLVLRRIGPAVVSEDEKNIPGSWQVEKAPKEASILGFEQGGQVVFSRRGFTSRVKYLNAVPLSNAPEFNHVNLDYALDPAAAPKRIDIVNIQNPPQLSIHGIYELKDDRLTINWSLTSNYASTQVPTSFASGPDMVLVVLKRAKAGTGKTPGQEKPAAAPAQTAEPQPTFGPVIERTINAVHEGNHENCLIDYDSGKVWSLPEEFWWKESSNSINDFAKNIPQLKQWAKKNGVDAMASRDMMFFAPHQCMSVDYMPSTPPKSMREISHASLSLNGLSLVVRPVKNRTDWDALTPEKLDALLERAVEEDRDQYERRYNNSYELNDFSKDLPITWMFKTREGGKGILQIVEVFKDQGLKIRYKMLQSPPAAPSSRAGTSSTPSKPVDSIPAPPAYRTAKITRGDISAVITVPGTIEPDEVVVVSAQVPGIIVSLGPDPRGEKDSPLPLGEGRGATNSPLPLGEGPGVRAAENFKGKSIDYGAPVEVGTVLARIDDGWLKNQAEQKKAKLQRADTELRAAQAKAQLADVEWKKAQEANKRIPGTLPDVELKRLQMNSTVAALAVESAKTALKESELIFKDASAILDHTVVKSPIKGVIIARRVNVGQKVDDSTILFQIAKDLKKVRVQTAFSHSNLGQIYEGMPLRLTVDAFPGGVFSGKVVRIDRNSSAPIVAVFDNPNLKLTPGLEAKLLFGITHRNVLRVPNEVLMDSWTLVNGEKTGSIMVKSPDGQNVRTMMVSMGLSDGKWIEVGGSDLKEGMEVVVGKVTEPPPYRTAKVTRGDIKDHRNVLRVPSAALQWSPKPDQVAKTGFGSAKVELLDNMDAMVIRGDRNTVEKAVNSLDPKQNPHPGMLWVITGDERYVRPIIVQTGSTDGTLVEVSGPDVKEGMEVVIGKARETDAGRNPSADPLQPVIPTMNQIKERQKDLAIQLKDMELAAPLPGKTSLSEAVRIFNARAAEDRIGKDQPPLTEDAVVAAIRWALLDPSKMPVSDRILASLKNIIQTRKLPEGFELEVITSFQPNDDIVVTNWSVRLRIPMEPSGTTCIMICDKIIDSRQIGPEEKKVIEKWNKLWKKQGGIASFDRPEYAKERAEAEKLDRSKQKIGQPSKENQPKPDEPNRGDNRAPSGATKISATGDGKSEKLSLLSSLRAKTARQSEVMRTGRAGFKSTERLWRLGIGEKYNANPSTTTLRGMVFFDGNNFCLDAEGRREPSVSVLLDAEGHGRPSTADHDDVKRYAILTKKWAAEWNGQTDVVRLCDPPGTFRPSQYDPRIISKDYVANSAGLDVKQVSYEGHTCCRLEEVFPGEGVRSVQILHPEKNFALLRRELYYDNTSRGQREKLREDYPFNVFTFDYRKDEGSGVWLPEKCLLREFETIPLAENRKPTLDREVTTEFIDYSFSQPPAKVFTLYHLRQLGAHRLHDNRKGPATGKWYDLPSPGNLADLSSTPDVKSLPPDLVEQWQSAISLER